MAYGVNAPFGLRPLCSINGGSWTEKTNEYNIAVGQNAGVLVTYATSIFTGDPVIWNPVLAMGDEANTGGGTIARYGFNTAGNNAGNAVSVLGVFMGCEYTLPNGTLVQSPYWPGGTVVRAGSKIKAFVLDDPDVLYDVQVSTWNNTLNDAKFTYGLLGQNFGLGLGPTPVQGNINNPLDGSVRTGQSAAYLAKAFGNNDPAHTLVTLPLKALYFTKNPNNLANPISYTADATTAPFLNVTVQINNHVYRAGSLGTVAE